MGQKRSQTTLNFQSNIHSVEHSHLKRPLLFYLQCPYQAMGDHSPKSLPRTLHQVAFLEGTDSRPGNAFFCYHELTY